MSEIIGLNDGKLLRSDYVYDTNQKKALSTILNDLKSFLKVDVTTVTPSGGSSTGITAKSVSGYTFLCWIGFSSNGWVGSPYVPDFSSPSQIIWDNGYTTTTSNHKYAGYALYIKNF